MDTYKLKFTRLQNEIFRLLCIKAGKSLNQREIAHLLGVSSTAVAKAVKDLQKEELIIIEKSRTMNLTLTILNRDNPLAIAYKRAENLKLVYETGLADYLESEFPGCIIVLFGSYSIGEDTVNSDIDIAVIGAKEKQIALERYSKPLEREVYLHFYEDISRINKNLKSNILNGITLSGVIEL